MNMIKKITRIKGYVIPISILLILLSPISNAFSQDEINLGTGILFPSNNGAVLTNAAALAYLKGEYLEGIFGASTINPTIDHGLVSYSGGYKNFGLGFAMEYLNSALYTRLAGGIDARYLLLGLNLWFNNTSFNSGGSLGVIVPLNDTYSIGATFSSILDPTRNLSIALGYAQTDKYFMEIDLPFDYLNATFNPSFSATYIASKDFSLNIGLGNMFSSTGNLPSVLKYIGTLNGGISYWIFPRVAISLLYNKFPDGYDVCIKGKY